MKGFEDDAAILEMVRAILASANFEVLVASSAESAVLVETAFQRTIHLLLSDIVMPDLCGPDLANVLKQRRPEMHHPKAVRAALVDRVTAALHTNVRDQGTDHFDIRA